MQKGKRSLNKKSFETAAERPPQDERFKFFKNLKENSWGYLMALAPSLNQPLLINRYFIKLILNALSISSDLVRHFNLHLISET